MSAYISSLGVANPDFRYGQAELVNFMARVHNLDEGEKQSLVALYRATGIHYRYSVLKDFQMNGHYDLYRIKDNGIPVAGTKIRMETFRDEALKLSIKAINNCTPSLKGENITHIITVSCTGFYTPGLDYDIIREFGLNPGIERYNINFMGCYAAINALKAGWNICNASKDANVLIVCTELCSIHLQKDPTDDNLLANAIFGDGSAAVIIKAEKPHDRQALELKEFFSDIIPAGIEEMAWQITDFGFQMQLSQYVPDIIRDGIGNLSKELFHKINKDQVRHFLVHPGGKKILKVVEEHFGITKSMNSYAHEVLRDHGNMSSPTILFVIKKFLDNIKSAQKGDNALALAFGPGLTLESALMEVTTE